MNREVDREKIKQILTATVVSLCNNALAFNCEMTVQGLIGITLDKQNIILVNIHETVGGLQSSGNVGDQVPAAAVKLEPQFPADGMSVPGGGQVRGCLPPAGSIEKSLVTPSGGIVTHRVEWSANDATTHRKQTPKSTSKSAGTLPRQQQRQTSVKLEPCSTDYYTTDPSGGGLAAGYNTYDNGWDQQGDGTDLYTDPATAAFTHQQQQQQQQSFYKPPAKKRMKTTQSTKKSPAVKNNSFSMPAASGVGGAGGGAVGGAKESTGSLVQRALELVNEGQLTAGVAIKLFGIPKSTFYKKLSDSKQQSTGDGQQFDGQFDNTTHSQGGSSEPYDGGNEQYYDTEYQGGQEEYAGGSGDIAGGEWVDYYNTV